jgi:hypothetical protein
MPPTRLKLTGTEKEQMVDPSIVAAVPSGETTMAKRERSGSGQAMIEIALLAPVVMAMRTLGLMAPSSNRTEFRRMISEKPLAAAEAIAAAQRATLKQGMDFWFGATRVGSLFWFELAENALSASLAPVRRRVRANSRRLARR